MKFRYIIIIFIMSTIYSFLQAGGLELPISPEEFDRLNPPIGVEGKELGLPSFRPAQEMELEEKIKTYYITAGDIVIVKLPDQKDFSEFEVNFEGYITLPKLGNFKAEGLTIEELEKSIFFHLPVYLKNMGEVDVQIKQKKNIYKFWDMFTAPGGVWFLKTSVFKEHLGKPGD